MNVFITVVTAVSFLLAAFFGNMNEMSNAIVGGASNAVTLVITLTGGLCFFGGIMQIIKASGLCDKISKLLRPFIRLVFPKLKKDGEAIKLISLNITANLLGIGNAATPLGIAAMRELQRENKNRKKPSADMINFVVINSSSIQLIPTTLALLRSKHGSSEPMSVLPAVIVCSVISLAVGLTVSRIFSAFERKKKNELNRFRSPCRNMLCADIRPYKKDGHSFGIYKGSRRGT